MSGNNRFSTSRSAKNHYHWFKGNENWNPGKVIKSRLTEEELQTYKEKAETRKHFCLNGKK